MALAQRIVSAAKPPRHCERRAVHPDIASATLSTPSLRAPRCPPRHCEQSEAIHALSRRRSHGLLRCARNDGTDCDANDLTQFVMAGKSRPGHDVVPEWRWPNALRAPRSHPVIASAALPPRPCERREVHPVIASKAKQSMLYPDAEPWIASLRSQ